MKGKFKIIVKNNRLHYEFEIKRNLTVIRGDSATVNITVRRSRQSGVARATCPD